MHVGNSTGVLDAFLDAFLVCATTECLGPGLNISELNSVRDADVEDSFVT